MTIPIHAALACRRALFVAAAFIAAPLSAQVMPVGDAPACPVHDDVPVLQAIASAGSDGRSIPAHDAGALDPTVIVAERAQERRRFESFRSERPLLAEDEGIVAELTATQRGALETASASDQRMLVGEAIGLELAVEFTGLDSAPVLPNAAPHARGRLARSDAGLIWETSIRSPGAKALRLQFDRTALADGARLFVYNELGQIDGPYDGTGPMTTGQWWTSSLVGGQVRVRIEADSNAALEASRAVIVDVIHLGEHFQVAEAIERSYAPETAIGRGNFCGTDLPPCSVNAQCAINTNPSLADTARAVAHINFLVGAQAYICTGTLINSTGSGPRPPYFLTANHCLSTQASASSLEAIFDYRTTACDTSCTMTPTVSVNGSTLLATGAAPQPDFTLLRLSSMPAGRILSGWTTEALAEGSYVLHLSHPAGAPLAYDVRRLRAGGLPVCGGVPRPAFLYTGLNQATGDAVGATVGGSSGAAALVLHPTFGPAIVGQLFGGCNTNEDECDANANATLDGALRSSFPSVRRFIYDGIFGSGFQAN
jgi:hypothetical protein